MAFPMYRDGMDMLELNYHHLLYFWVAAREGGIGKACEKLDLAQPTISAQINKLEKDLGQKLFQRAGRGIALTEAGEVVFGYADAIFRTGQDLLNALAGRAGARPSRVVVGIADVLPKLVVHRLLEPLARHPDPVHIVCREGKTDRLLGDLAVHELDVVLSDTLPGPFLKVKSYVHSLGESGLTFFAAPKLMRRLKGPFPKSLRGAPLLLPLEGSPMRMALEQWLRANKVVPVIQAEIEDSALIKAFGQAGDGVFAMPGVIEAEICARYGVRVMGRADGPRTRFHAITAERVVRHPAVVTLMEQARAGLFARR